MANIKSQKKRIRTNEIARVRNKAAASAACTRASRALDKAVAKGVIHKNQAANRKSGLQNLVNGLN